MPQVRRGQIGTNQAVVVERKRRVELNLGGRKGTERKVLGLGLGARISRRGVRAHEVGRHLHAEDEGDEGRARHGALEDLVAGRGHGRVVGPVREVVVVRQVHLRLARGARRRRRGRSVARGRCRVLLDRGRSSATGPGAPARAPPRPVGGPRRARTAPARHALRRSAGAARPRGGPGRAAPPVGADRGGDAARAAARAAASRVRGRRRVVGGRRRHLRLGHLAREERPASARRGRADGALAQRGPDAPPAGGRAPRTPPRRRSPGSGACPTPRRARRRRRRGPGAPTRRRRCSGPGPRRRPRGPPSRAGAGRSSPRSSPP